MFLKKSEKCPCIWPGLTDAVTMTFAEKRLSCNYQCYCLITYFNLLKWRSMSGFPRAVDCMFLSILFCSVLFRSVLGKNVIMWSCALRTRLWMAKRKWTFLSSLNQMVSRITCTASNVLAAKSVKFPCSLKNVSAVLLLGIGITKRIFILSGLLVLMAAQTNGMDIQEKIAVLDAGAQYGKVNSFPQGAITTDLSVYINTPSLICLLTLSCRWLIVKFVSWMWSQMSFLCPFLWLLWKLITTSKSKLSFPNLTTLSVVRDS